MSADEVAHSLRRYLSMKSAYAPDFLPGDKSVAYLTDLTGVPQIWMTDTSEDRVPQQITLEDERVAHFSVGPKSGNIVFGMDKGGNERFQIYMLEDLGDSVVKLTDDPKVIHNWGDWSPDEKRISFSSNARSQEFFDIYVEDIDDRSTALVYRYDGNAYPVSWSPDGSKILLEVTHTPFDHDLFLLDPDDKNAELLTPHTGDAAFYSPTFDWSGKFVYCATDKDREFVALARIDVGSHELEYVYAEDWDIEGLVATRDKRTVAFTVNDGGASRLMLWGPRRRSTAGIECPQRARRRTGLVKRRAKACLLPLSLLGEHRRMDVRFRTEHGIDAGSADQADQVLHVRDTGDKFRRAAACRDPLVRRAAGPSYLYLPKTGASLPLVVLLHGGPESQFRPGFSPLIQFFVRMGFGVLAPNFRGSTGYGRRYTHLDDVRGRMDTVKDAEFAVRHVLERYPIDRNKVVAWGGSYGGFMVLACLYSSPKMWAAGVDIVGISNIVTFLKNTGPWRRKLRIAEYGDPEKDKDFLESISPNNNAHLITAPLFIIHGANDPRVPVGEAEQIAETLKKLGREAHMMRFDDEGHGLAKLKNRIAGYSAAVEFLMSHVSSQGEKA